MSLPTLNQSRSRSILSTASLLRSTTDTGSIVFLHIGQAGVQCGSTMWELFCQEHNLNPYGKLDYEVQKCKDLQFQREQKCLQVATPIPSKSNRQDQCFTTGAKSNSESKAKSNFTSNSKSKPDEKTNSNSKKSSRQNSNPSYHKFEYARVNCSSPRPFFTSPLIQTVFVETPRNSYRPRALFIDLEPSSIQSSILERKELNHLFNPQQLISGKEDCCCRYSSGYYHHGPEFLDLTLSRIATIVESSCRLQGFFITRSCAGGTGSGFSSLLLSQLAELYPKATKVTVDILPSSISNVTQIDPYNVLLSLNRSIESSDISFPIQNDALDFICQDSLSIPSPTYGHYNRIIAQVISALTCCMQFPGTLNSTLYELKTNSVVYPRLHYPILSYVPLLSPQQTKNKRLSVHSMLEDLLMGCKGKLACNTNSLEYQHSDYKEFRDSSAKIKIEASKSIANETLSNFVFNATDLLDINMTYNILYRGAVTSTDVKWTEAVLENGRSFSNIVRFMDWVPGEIPQRCGDFRKYARGIETKGDSKGSAGMAMDINALGVSKTSKKSLRYKIGMCSQPPSDINCYGNDVIALSDQATVGISNSTGISLVFAKLLQRFDRMYKKKAFLHWYKTDGMEEAEFTEGRKNVQALIQEYEEISRYHKPIIGQKLGNEEEEALLGTDAISAVSKLDADADAIAKPMKS